MTAPATFTITINVGAGGAVSDQSVLSTFRSNNLNYAYSNFTFSQNSVVDSVAITDTHTTFTYQDGYYTPTGYDDYGYPYGYYAVPTNHTANQISDIRIAGTSAQLRALAAGQSLDVVVHYTDTGYNAFQNYPYGFGENISSTAEQMTFHFVGVNEAPVLTGTTLSLATELEDAAAPVGSVGTAVTALLSDFTDYDSSSPAGIAVSGADGTHGTWWYSADDGVTWSQLGAVSETGALLLAASGGRLYFQPVANFNGTVDPAITFHGWDQTQGTSGGTADVTSNGGATAFSAATDSASLTITAVNDLPVIASIGALSYTENQAPTLLAPAASVTDIDSANFNGGFLKVSFAANGSSADQLTIVTGGLVKLVGTPVSINGTVIGTVFTVSINGTAIGTVASSGANGSALQVDLNSAATPADVQVLMQHIAYANTSDDPSTAVRTVTFEVSDGSDTASATSTISVTAVNDAPVVNGVTFAVTEGGTSVLTAANFNITDPDSTSLTYTVSNVTHGVFQTTTDGITWTNATTFATADIAAGHVHFVHDGGEIAPGFSIQANDGATANNLSGVVAGSVTFTNVNDAPVLLTPLLMDFQDIPHPLDGGFTPLASYSAGGFVFSSSHVGADAFESFHLGHPFYAGSAALANSYEGATTTLQRADGAAFDLDGIDLDSLLTGASSQVTFVGTLAGGGTVQQTFTLDALRGFETFAFSSDFNHVTSVSWAQTSPYLMIDNVHLDPVPVLASITEDDVANAGQTVASFLANIADPDAGALQGMAITATADGNGHWEYSTGAGWVAIGAVDDAHALLLRASDLVRFVPNAERGTSASFTYHAWDQSGSTDGQQGRHADLSGGTGGSTPFSSATQTVTISVTDVNDAPVAAVAAESNAGNEDTAINGTLLAGKDVDGDALHFALVAGSAQHGSVMLDPTTGAYTFTPNHDYNGAASFQYVVNDGTVDSAPKTVNLTIAPVNDPPVVTLTAESNAGNEDTAITGTLLAGSDVDRDALSFVPVPGSAQHGAVAINPGTGAYTFTPDHDYNGAASFQYVLNDGTANSAAKTVSLTVAPVNDAPVAAVAAESKSGNEDTAISGTLLAGTDVDGDALHFALVNGSAQHGSVSIDANTGAYTFTPDHDYNGAASFQYVLDDGTTNSAPKTVAIAIAPVNDPPVLANAIANLSLAEDTAWSYQVPANTFFDVDGDTLSYAATLGDGSPLPGWLSFNAATRTFSGTPPKDFNGSFDFKVTASDAASSVSDTFTLNVTPVDDAPVFVLSNLALVSTSATGATGNSFDYSASFSPDGTKVLFMTGATNLLGSTNWANAVIKDLTTGALTRVSQTATGTVANGFTDYAAFSADGTRVVFESRASNLVTGDSNSLSDVFVKDLATGAVVRVSTTATGAQASGNTTSDVENTPHFSPDGKYVVFSSFKTNLVSGDTNGDRDIFVKAVTDANGNLISNGAIVRVSTAAGGAQSVDQTGSGAGDSDYASFSADGTKVLFVSGATNLVAGDTNNVQDVFLKSIFDQNGSLTSNGAVTLVSQTQGGVLANSYSNDAFMSADGSRVAFDTYATNLAPGVDTNSFSDVYVKDLRTGALILASVSKDGVVGNGNSSTPTLSADGTKVLFYSKASNLVAGDTADGTWDLFVKNLVTGDVTRIPLGNNSFDIPQSNAYFSPDGSKVLFYANQDLLAADTNLSDDIYIAGPVAVANVTSIENVVALLDASATVSDAELDLLNGGAGNYGGTTLTLVRHGGASAQDAFGFAASGMFTVSGNTLQAGGQTFATVTNTGGTLQISFTSAATVATKALVNDVLQHVTYANTSDAPPASVQIDYALNNGNAGAQGSDQGSGGALIGTGYVDVVITGVNDAPVVTAGNTLNYTENGAATAISPAATVTDPDGATDFNGGSLKISFGGTGTLADQLTVGGTGITITGTTTKTIKIGSNTVGTYSSTTNNGVGGNDLVITFASSGSGVTPANVQTLLEHILYNNTSDAPSTTDRTITYTINDNDGTANNGAQLGSGTATIHVTAVNDTPVAAAAAESKSGNEDTAISGTLLAGTDADGDALSFVLVPGSAQHGTVVINPTSGAYTFTPDRDYNGAASFQYVVNDGTVNSAAKTVGLTLAPVNDAPVAAAAAESNSGNEDTPITGTLLAGSDVDGNALHFALVAGSAQHGAVSINANTGAYTFTPDHDYNGAALFQYVVNDGAVNSAPKTVTIAIAPVNDAPIAASAVESNAGNEDTPITGTLLAGSDVDGDPLSFVLVNGSSQHGSVAIDAATGAYTFTPDHDYNGAASFQYVVNDGTADSVSKTVTIAIAPVNDAPVAAPAAESNAGNEDTAITGTLLAGSDADGDPLSFVVVPGSAQHGAVSIDAATGADTFTPDHDYNGAASFQYVVNDGTADSAAKIVNLTIAPVNDAPVAQDGSAGGHENATITSSVVANDVEDDTLTYGLVAQAAHGTVTVNLDGTFGYTPNANYHGTDSFTFKANDGALDSNIATETLTVDFVNQAPAAQDGSASGNENAVITGSLATSDIEGDALTYGVVTQAAHGTVAINADGTFDYTPDANYHGPDSFTFRANDGALDSNVATETLTVAFVNQPPVAQAGSASGNENAVITGSLSASDAEGDTLTYGVVTQAAHGTVTVNPNGTFSYTPDANYHGTDSFSFKANDGALDSNVATENLAIAFVNQPPALHDVAAAASYAGGAVILAPGLTIADVDSTTLASATVHVGAGAFTAHGDVLIVSAAGLAGTTIAANYDAASETLTLTGTDTLAHYQQALEHVTFQTSNFAADHAQSIAWQVNDGAAANNLSAPETTAISMPRSQVNDFNGSGHSGLLWQNTDGTAAVWSVDGTSLVSGASVGFNPGSSWHAIGSGDFNGDGKADILWQNADGTPAVWLMDGSNILSGANVGFNPGAAWHVIGSGDFDGDGKSDILWQNQNGQAAVWLMDGTNLKSGANVASNPGADWHVIGSGDFDGDGKADILWQNKNGQAAVWLMDGENLKAGANVGFNPGADWHVQGSGDFNGDGKADILWQNAKGQAAVWEMNGLNVLSGANVGFNPGPAWQVHGTGDFNGDGKADIAWQNTDGTAAVWLMDGYNVVSGANVGLDPGANWHVVPQHHDLM